MRLIIAAINTLVHRAITVILITPGAKGSFASFDFYVVLLLFGVNEIDSTPL